VTPVRQPILIQRQLEAIQVCQVTQESLDSLDPLDHRVLLGQQVKQDRMEHQERSESVERLVNREALE